METKTLLFVSSCQEYVLLRTQTRNYHVQTGALSRGICSREGPIPVQSEVVVLTPVRPDAVRVLVEEVCKPLLGTRLLQDAQITRKDAFELTAVCTAPGRLTRFVKNSIAIGQSGNSSVCDTLRDCDVTVAFSNVR